MMKIRIYTSILFVFLTCFLSYTQTLEEGRELYKIGEYKKALPIFEREYLLKPTDASLNQWYGVSLYETGGDINKAEEYIKFAASKNVQDAYLYLGKIYAKTYRFDEAEKEFTRYEKLKKRDKVAMANLEEARDRASLLKRAALRTEDIQVIDSVVVNKDMFLSVYKLSPNSGYIDYYNNFFENRPKSESTIYVNEKGNKAYFAKMNNLGKYSLFSMEKLMEDFSNERKLSSDDFSLTGNINYPFLMPDGTTIYFAAEDKEGFGGYDIYVTRYNINNDTYLTPERLNMPFNSPFNDYMMVIDEDKGIGWFATDRFQPEGKVCIYTFIPNETTELVDNENDKYIINRAKISSIKETQKPGRNYSSLIQLARKEIERKTEEIHDFVFVINDQFTYYSLGDFKNQTARDEFYKSQELFKELEDIGKQLEKLRDGYQNDKSATRRNEILSLEKRQEQLYENIRTLELSARNQEVRFLNK